MSLEDDDELLGDSNFARNSRDWPRGFRGDRKVSGGSTASQNWHSILEGTHRDIETEIAYVEDMIILTERHRQIELDPNFWSLDDDFVTLLNNGSHEEIQETIEKEEKWITEFKTRLSKANRMTRFMHSVRAAFRAGVGAFPSLFPIPNDNEPAEGIETLVNSICKLLLQLEETTVLNVELEMKLVALNEHIAAIQSRLKERHSSQDENQLQARLEATELQNWMLNELLNKIIHYVQDTSEGMKTLEPSNLRDVKPLIRAAVELNFAVLDDCFPALNDSAHSPAKFLWIPHDGLLARGQDLTTLMSYFTMTEPLQPGRLSQQVKRLKTSLKDLEETIGRKEKVKKKIAWADERRIVNFSNHILRYNITKENESKDRITLEADIVTQK